jgi:hypothetical protein
MKLKLFTSKPNLPVTAALIGGAMFALPFTGTADTYVITNTTADAFLASGSAGNPAGANLTANNYGGAGALAIAPASSTKGEFDSVIMFNTASAVSQFNTTYGAGNWTITGLMLSLASNTGTSGAVPGNTIFNTVNGGNFGIDWLSYDAWVEGTGTPSAPSATGVNFNSISTLLAGSDSLGTFTYTPPGNNVYANYSLSLDAGLVSDAAASGNVSLYFFAADNQVSCLFNSRTFASGRPELSLTATPAPEPATMSLLAVSLGSVLWLRGRTIRI